MPTPPSGRLLSSLENREKNLLVCHAKKGLDHKLSSRTLRDLRRHETDMVQFAAFVALMPLGYLFSSSSASTSSSAWVVVALIDSTSVFEILAPVGLAV